MAAGSGDPWADPDYSPDTSRGLPAETGNAMGAWAQQQMAREAAGDEGALMERDRDLMIMDGMPLAAAEQEALRHARARAVQADREPGA